jgi:2'-5' RNA ligase
MRLFVAFEISEEARAAALDAVAPLRERFPRARWVPPENLHVTLKFLGEVYPRLERWVPERVETTAAGLAPFEVRLESLGAFRSPRSARVVWIGLGDDPDGAMRATADALAAALAKEYPPEKRPFAAHLTLARSDPPIALAPEDLEVDVAPVAWTVDHVVLFRSHLRRPAPRYEPLARVPLGLRGERSSG